MTPPLKRILQCISWCIIVIIFVRFITACRCKEGCTDFEAVNYNAEANEDNNTCCYHETTMYSDDDYVIDSDVTSPHFDEYILTATYEQDFHASRNSEV